MPIPDIGRILASPKQIGGNACETAVIKAWLAKHYREYDRVEIERRLGPGLELPPGAPAYLQRCATVSWQLRADMICWSGNTPTIVEAKERIGPDAIGQLLMYQRLLTKDNPTILQVYKIAAGQSICNGIESYFYDYGITVELFPGAIPPTPT